MKRKKINVCSILLICLSLFGCGLSSVLSTQWSENFALATAGAVAIQTSIDDMVLKTLPELNDGKINTIATAWPKDQKRIFVLKFPAIKQIRRIVIYNQNLFRFNIEYWDNENSEWKTAYSIRQRRNLDDERAQPKYVIDRLNFKTDLIRINVSRTVDDRVISKMTLEPNDMMVDHRRETVGGRYLEYYRVINPSEANLREVEVYHLATKEK